MTNRILLMLKAFFELEPSDKSKDIIFKKMIRKAKKDYKSYIGTTDYENHLVLIYKIALENYNSYERKHSISDQRLNNYSIDVQKQLKKIKGE